MGKRDVLLHLCGLFRPLRARLVANHAGRKDGTARPCDTNCLAGNFADVGDPERHDFPVAGVEAPFESLAEHHLGRALYRNHPHHDVELGVLYILWNHRNHTDGTCSLVRMEMAQTEGNLTGAI
jgi:hypothetical protein